MLVSGTVGSECLEILISHHKTHQFPRLKIGVLSLKIMKAIQFPIGSMYIYIIYIYIWLQVKIRGPDQPPKPTGGPFQTRF